MWEQIIDDVHRERELTRKESEVTVSTVETFVSQNNISDIEAPVDSANDDPETAKNPQNISNVPKWKIFWWNHSDKFLKILFVTFLLVGISLLVPGLYLPNIACKANSLDYNYD